MTALSERTREADELVSAAAQRLVTHLTQIESAGAAAAARVGEAESSFSMALDTLLDRTATTLDEIRGGIDTQSAAVSALVEQASAGIGRAGVEAADVLGAKIGQAGASLDGLSARVAEQERVSQRMFAEIDRGLTLIGERFAELSAHGDDRANHFLGSLSRARTELDALAEQAGSQDYVDRGAGGAHRGSPPRDRPTHHRDPRRPGERDRRCRERGRAGAQGGRDRQAGDRLDARRRGRSERSRSPPAAPGSPIKPTVSPRCWR